MARANLNKSEEVLTNTTAASKYYLPKNQHAQRKLLNFENWCSGEVSKSAKHLTLRIRILLFFIAEYQFRSTYFSF